MVADRFRDLQSSTHDLAALNLTLNRSQSAQPEVTSHDNRYMCLCFAGDLQGLTHTGSVNCKVDGDSNILRDPQQCRPDWYGDPTSFMGAGGLMSVPNALRYKVWSIPPLGFWHNLLLLAMCFLLSLLQAACFVWFRLPLCLL